MADDTEPEPDDIIPANDNQGPKGQPTAFCLVFLAAMTGSAKAQAPPTAHVVSGFRGAVFGMASDEVRRAIATDLKPAVGAVTEQDNPVV
ncbi:MAG: hypothetical protein JWM91_4927 [Rhodospirillales bacterium]|nr:hypothetical protein [Rhodospirillales bacterium]